MKLLDLDRSTLDFLKRIAEYGSAQQFPDTLFETFYHDTINDLQLKIHKAHARVNGTTPLTLTPAEAICLRWTLEFYNSELPDTYAVDVLRKYFSPLNIAA